VDRAETKKLNQQENCAIAKMTARCSLYVIVSAITIHQRHRQTDGRHALKTELCTTVHCAVKIQFDFIGENKNVLYEREENKVNSESVESDEIT